MLVVPFMVMMSLAAIDLLVAPRTTLAGTEWPKCLLAIPILAVPPFAAIVWAVRRGAPTELTRTGSVAGLVAGALGAMAYALHGRGDALPYIALWYGGTFALCTLAGALLGPRLLRW